MARRHGRHEEAKKTLIRLASPGYWDDKNIDAYIAVIQHTDDLEKAEAATGTWWELFKSSNLRRTEIVSKIDSCKISIFDREADPIRPWLVQSLGAWAIQVWSGTAMTAYAVEL